MRDLVFKNLTSEDKKRRVLISSETMDKEGLRSTIQRHFICIVKEVKNNNKEKPLPQLYVSKERDTLKQVEKFSCKLKGSVYAISGKRLFLILYMRALNITVTPAPHFTIQ